MTKKEQTRAALYAAIKTHGEVILSIFPNAREPDPVKLCKRLRRIEAQAERARLAYCNGEIQSGEWEEEVAEITRKVGRLFDVCYDSLEARGFFVNGDPRGYALKLEDSFTTGYNNKRREQGKPELHRDWGGYGILAPDLTIR